MGKGVIGKVVVVVAFAVLGLMLATQLRLERLAPPTDARQLAATSVLLSDAQKENTALGAEVAKLRDEIAHQEVGATLAQELERARMAAGLVSVQGPGVQVVMTEGSAPAGAGSSVQLAYQIHDSDVLQVLNELRAAGAEAMSINGQRVLATTEVRRSGNVFSINNMPAAPPFTILAVGNPSVLAAALEMRGGIIDAEAVWGIKITVQKESRVVIPAYSGVLHLGKLHPVTGKTG